MNLEELKDVWQSQNTRNTVHAVLLLEAIRRKTRHYNRVLVIRNFREGWGTIIAALLLIFNTTSDAESQLQLLPWYSAMAILFGIGLYRVIDNTMQKKKTSLNNDSVTSFIISSLSEIEHRIWLLTNIFWWWVLPILVGCALIVFQIILLVGLQDPVSMVRKLSVGVGIGVVVVCAVYWGNLWTARKYWLPRKAELEEIYKSLQAD